MSATGLVVAFMIGSVGTLALGILAKWVDRKVTARVQWRAGPPWYQPAVDCLKLMGKETLLPASGQSSAFLVAPLVGLAAACLAATLLWVMNFDRGIGFVGDIIVVIYLLAIPSVAIMIGAAAAGNPYTGIGASREMKLLLSYELPLILVLLVAIVQTGGSFLIAEILAGQEASPVALFSISGTLALLVAIFCMQAKLGLIPFDQAEAETELMAGVFTEYSGPALGIVFLTRMVMLIALPLLLITAFLGGIFLTGWAVLVSLVKLLVLLVLITLLRNTNPRVRIDQSVKFFWFIATPAALAALVLALLGQHYQVGWL